jgi:hypothetical protein
MLATSSNVASREMTENCYQKARFCETPEPDNEDDDNSEVSPRMCEDAEEKTNVTFIFEEYAEADDHHLPCAVQETDDLCIEDKNTETEDEEAAACKPVLCIVKQCRNM